MKKQQFNKLKNLSLLLLALSFLLTTGMQCKKTDETTKEDVLPAETQTGKETFGCLVNGKVWVPKGKFPYSGLTTVIQFDIINLSASNYNESINIGVRDFKKIGVYNLSNVDNEFNFYGVNYKCKQGLLTVKKYDTLNQILSGTFEATGESSQGDIMNLTEGRFDVKYTN